MPHEMIPMGEKMTSIEDFINTMSMVENQNQRNLLSPSIIRLQGSKGEWLERRYNEVEKKSEEIPFKDFSDGTFLATPLITTYFAKWKFDENNKSVVHRTREFLRFDNEEIELLKITYGDKTDTQIVDHFDSYHSFKEHFVTKDKLTEKISSPFDLWVAIYAYHWEMKRIIKITLKGSSRSAWFDFPNKAKKEQGVKSITQLNVQFGYFKDQMADGKEFFTAQMTVKNINNQESMQTIMQAGIDLNTWMKSWKRENEEPTVIEPETEIKIEDIPF